MIKSGSSRIALMAEEPETLRVSESEKVVIIEMPFYRVWWRLVIFTIILSIDHA